MFKKSKSALFLMGSFLGGLGASFVSYAVNDASFLLDDDGPIDDFDDNNLGKLVFSDQEISSTSTDLGVKENSPSGGVADDLSITEGNTHGVDAGAAAGDSATGKIDVFSSDSEIGKNLDTSIDTGKETDDSIDVLNLKNDINTGDVLDNTTDQGIAGSGEIDGLYNNKVDNDLNSPLDVGKDVTVSEDLGDLYSEGNNNNKLDKPDDPTKDEDQKSVSEKNNGLKFLGGLTAGIAGPLALIKYNKGLKSSGWLDKLINMIKSLWMPEDAATSADDKNPEVKDPQQMDVEKPGEEPIGSVAPSDLNTPETDKEHVSDPNENVDQDQGGIYDGASVFSILVKLFGILVKLFGIFGAVLIIICILKNKSETKKSADEKKKEMQDHTNETQKGENKKKIEKDGNTTVPGNQEKEVSLIKTIRKGFKGFKENDKVENSKKVPGKSANKNEKKKLLGSISTDNILGENEKDELSNSMILSHKMKEILRKEEKEQQEKEQAAEEAFEAGVKNENIEKVIKDSYLNDIGYITVKEICEDLGITPEILKKLIDINKVAESANKANAVQEELEKAIQNNYGVDIMKKIQEKEIEIRKKEEEEKKIKEEKERLEKEKLEAAQEVINGVVTSDKVKKIIEEQIEDLKTYNINVDEIYEEGDCEELRKQIGAEEIVKGDQDSWQATVENKLKEKVGKKYKDTVKNKVNETIQSAQNFINEYVTAEKVKKVAESILIKNGIIKEKIKEKEKENAVLRIFGIDNLCREEELAELRGNIAVDEVAKLESTQRGKFVEEKLKTSIENAVIREADGVISKIKKIQRSVKIFLEKKKDRPKKIFEDRGIKNGQAAIKSCLIKDKDKVFKLQKLEELLKKVVKKINLKKLKDNVNKMQIAAAKAAIEDGITEGKIKEIIQKEYIKESKAITADAIYKGLNVNIDALKEKIKVEEIIAKNKNNTAEAVKNALASALKNLYGKRIKEEINNAKKIEKERLEREKKKEDKKNQGKKEKEEILRIYSDYAKKRKIDNKEDVVKIEIVPSKFPSFLNEAWNLVPFEEKIDGKVLLLLSKSEQGDVVLKPSSKSKTNGVFFKKVYKGLNSYWKLKFVFEKSSDLEDLLRLDTNEVNSTSRKTLTVGDIFYPKTEQKSIRGNLYSPRMKEKITKTYNNKKIEMREKNDINRVDVKKSLADAFDQQGNNKINVNNQNHIEHNIVYIKEEDKNKYKYSEKNKIRPNYNISLNKNKIIINGINKTGYKLFSHGGYRKKYLGKNNNVNEGSFLEKYEKTENDRLIDSED